MMNSHTKIFLAGCAMVVGLTACAGCGTGDGKSGDPVSKDSLSFYRIEKDDREVQFYVTLKNCRGEERACYTVVALDTDSEDRTGRSTEGDLTDEQLETLNALLTPEQLKNYEKDQDSECEGQGELRYTIFYDDSEGRNHFYCLLPGDHLSSETEGAIEVMTEMAEKLLKEGTPVEDEN